MSNAWREILASEMMTPTPTARQTTAVGLNVRLHDIIADAAKSRGMTASAYMRRAAVAFAVHDLGLDWVEVMQDEPPQATAARPNMGRGAQAWHGRGFGPWEILGLAVHDHE